MFSCSTVVLLSPNKAMGKKFTDKKIWKFPSYKKDVKKEYGVKRHFEIIFNSLNK